MSAHVIYYQDGAKHMRPISSAEEYHKLRASARQAATLKEARSGDKQAKRSLLQFNYSCLPNDDSTLKGSVRLSDSVGMDVDMPGTASPPALPRREGACPIKEDWLAKIPEIVLEKKEELGLLMLERSVSKGYHIVFKRHTDMSQEENLRWASDLLGIPFDEAAKDHTRVFFTTSDTAEDLLFLSEDLFDNERPPKSPCIGGVEEVRVERQEVSAEKQTTNPHDTTYDGIPYTLLVETLADQLGGVPAHGSRNNFIFSMACHLRYVCNDDPEWILSVLPAYGEERSKVERTVRSACSRAQSCNIPQIVQRTISLARAKSCVSGCCPTEGEGAEGFNIYASPTPPEMPGNLPRLIQLLVSKVDKMYRPAVAQAVFPPLGAHLHGVRTRYIDNSEADLGGFMSVCMAKQSIGKGSVNMPIDLIMEDIRQRDDYSRELERQWKQQCKSAKASEKKPPRPNGICIQFLMSNMTNAALVQRLVDAEAAGGKFLYTRLDEIEMLDQIKASGGATASEIIRLAHNQALYGQERVGTESVTGTPPLRFNFNASTTVPTGQAYFAKGLTNGTLSRLTLSTIIKPMGKHGIPRFGDYDDEFRSQLAVFIRNLNSATGTIGCSEAEELAEELCEENADFAELSADDVFETLSYRACRIAHDKAKLLYIAHGYKWDESIADFCRWSMQYDLWLKLHFFGEKMRIQSEESQTKNAGPKNLLDMVRDRFSLQDITFIYQAMGKQGDIKQLIYTWTNRGYIEQDAATKEYVKTEKYLSRHKHV